MGGTVAPKPPGLPRAERRNGGLGSGLRQLDGGTWSHVGSPEKAADQQPTMTGGRLINHPFKHKHYGDYFGDGLLHSIEINELWICESVVVIVGSMYEESEEDEEYHAYEYDGGSEGDSCDCDCDDGTAV